MRSYESNILDDLEGTEITTGAKPNFDLPSKTWIITEKLKELSASVTQDKINDGFPPGFATAKFLCHLKGDPTKQPAFMRIYNQIPIPGTELSKKRATQAVATMEFDELAAFKSLMNQGCSVVPQLLRYQQGTQGVDGAVPGGYVTTIVWEKVPGESLSEEYFWGLPREQRDMIRKKFRRVWDLCGAAHIHAFLAPRN